MPAVTFVPKPNWRIVLAEQTFIGARMIALRVEALAIEKCPVSPDGGGALRKSHFRRESLDAAFGWRMQIGANKPYAYFVHQGTHAHPIVAKNAQALHFNWPKMGGGVFFVSVNHPSTKPQPWLWDAANTIIRASVL